MIFTRRPKTREFARQPVELSLVALYLALHLDDGADADLHALLYHTLRDIAYRNDRAGLLEKALSRMPDAIVPFDRDSRDIYMAAAMQSEISHLRFSSDGHVVDAGYFTCAGSQLQYVDVVGKYRDSFREVMSSLGSRHLRGMLSGWSQQPEVVVAEGEADELLRLCSIHAGAVPTHPAAASAGARGGQSAASRRATVTLLRLTEADPGQDAPDAARVERVAWGQVAWQSEPGAMVLRDAPAEMLMDFHAAQLTAQEAGHRLWLHIRLDACEVLAAAPDFLHAPSRQPAWVAPVGLMAQLLKARVEVPVRVPRWAALRLMKRFAWVWSPDAFEWVRWAWCLQQQPQWLEEIKR